MDLIIDEVLKQGIEAHKKGWLEKAKKLYVTILVTHPVHLNANINLGILLETGLSDKEGAHKFLSAIVKISSNTARFWVVYLETLIKLDKMDDAQKVLTQAQESGVEENILKPFKKKLQTEGTKQKANNIIINTLDSMTVPQALNAVSQKLNDVPETHLTVTQQGIAQKSPQSKKALQRKKLLSEKHFQNGLVYHLNGKLEGALHEYRQAIAIEPNYSEAFSNLAVVQKARGNLNSAIENYKRAIRINPAFAEAHSNFGSALLVMGDITGAIESCQRAIQIDNSYANAYFNLGLAWFEQNNLDTAIQSYEKAIEINPEYAEAFSSLGSAHYKNGNVEKAILYYQLSIQINPGYAEPYTNLAIAFTEQGKIDTAIKNFNRALQIHPSYIDALVYFYSLITQVYAYNSTRLKLTDEWNKQFLDQRLENPRIMILGAINQFLAANFGETSNYLSKFKEYNPVSEYKDKKFSTAYCMFLERLITQKDTQKPHLKERIYHIGESHSLSYAHQHFTLGKMGYSIHPLITFGAKAYHFSQSTENQYKSITRLNLEKIPKRSKVFLSFGEIDCRSNEGIIPAANKLAKTIDDVTDVTVRGFVGWFANLNQKVQHDLHFLGIPAPVYDKTVPHEVNKLAALVVTKYNECLVKNLNDHQFKYIDVYSLTRESNGFSNTSFHIDNRHLGPSIIPYIEIPISHQNDPDHI